MPNSRFKKLFIFLKMNLLHEFRNIVFSIQNILALVITRHELNPYKNQRILKLRRAVLEICSYFRLFQQVHDYIKLQRELFSGLLAPVQRALAPVSARASPLACQLHQPLICREISICRPLRVPAQSRQQTQRRPQQRFKELAKKQRDRKSVLATLQSRDERVRILAKRRSASKQPPWKLSDRDVTSFGGDVR